jgi:hypothetical protein
MLVRTACCAVFAFSLLVPQDARAKCAQEISQLMSRDTEKLNTRFNRVSKRIKQHGATARLRAEECRIARQLTPRLEQQLAALRQSSCIEDPEMGSMVADIVRGHEDDLALVRKTTSRSECQ